MSVLDLGIQAAVVKFVAEHYARAEFVRLNHVVGNALAAYLILGVMGSEGLVLFATFFLNVFQIPSGLVAITRILFYVLAVQVFFEFPGLAFYGILEGLQRHDLLHLIDMGRLLIYALLVFMLLSQGYGVIALGVLTGAVMIGRLLITAAISKRVLPPTMRFRLHFDRSTLSQI